MSTSLDGLIDLLDLEPVEVNIFRGTSPDEARIRVFGGQVAAQALTAAGRTVDKGRVHSLHAYFLRPGDTKIPILYEVDRIRDGRSFTTRRVVAIQHGEAIFNLSASFHVAEESLEHQVPMPEAPSAESLPTLGERAADVSEELGNWFSRPFPIDQRYVQQPPGLGGGGASRQPRQQVWFRANGKLPDDPLLHACVVTYASDLSLMDAILLPHEVRWDDPAFMGASLDHCMWFHRPLRADSWLLYDQDSPVAAGGRGLARGSIFTSDGTLAASVVQEGLIRFPQARERSS